MRFQISFVTGAAMLASWLTVPELRADSVVLPNPEFFESFNVNQTYQFSGFNSGSFQAPCSQGPSAPICGQIDLTSYPAASVSASISAYAGQMNTVEAEVAYYYEIVIPGSAQSNTPGNTLIPLIVSGYASFTYSIGSSTTIGGTLQNFAEIVVAGQGSHGGTVATGASSTPSIGPSSFQVAANAYAYVPNAISLRVFGSIYNNGDATPGTVTGFVDPVISFAPGFDSTGYSIVVSPGVANGPTNATPEPATFALAGLGLAVIVLVSRRDRLA